MSITLESVTKASIGTSTIMAGEIPGLEVSLIHLDNKTSKKVSGDTKIDQIIIVQKGQGIFTNCSKEVPIGIGSLVRPAYGTDWTIKTNTDIVVIHLVRILNEEDIKELKIQPIKHSSPLIINVDDCPTYTEDCKSEKTLNRMILQEGFIPRLCIGSVKTIGPDSVDVHEHPMLEQLFLGLENCKCTIHANEDTTVLNEGNILHIPLASKHSVTVNEGNTLHYMWIDFFESLKAQSYMQEAHNINEN